MRGKTRAERKVELAYDYRWPVSQYEPDRDKKIVQNPVGKK